MLMNEARADVTAGAFVPEAEVRDLFRYEGERRILEYVFYPLEDYTSKVTVDDAQIKDYYEANQASFTVPPQADVESAHRRGSAGRRPEHQRRRRIRVL